MFKVLLISEDSCYILLQTAAVTFSMLNLSEGSYGAVKGDGFVAQTKIHGTDTKTS